MTFDNDELREKSPRWFIKHPIKEEISSEIHTLTTDNLLKKMITFYDQETDGIVNEFATGVCSVCGNPFVNEKYPIQCFFGDISCVNCRILYGGRPICRKHVETKIGSKEETMVLISIGFGLKKDKTKLLIGLSDDDLNSVKNLLLNRGYLKEKSLGIFFDKIGITYEGNEIVSLLAETYSHDSDFKSFLENIGWGGNVAN